MKIIKNFIYSKTLYINFIYNLKKAFENYNIVIKFDFQDDYFKLYVYYPENILIINKIKNEKLNIQYYTYDEYLIEIKKSDLKKHIISVKNNGEILSSEYVIDYIYKNLSINVNYYKITNAEVKSIFNEILSNNIFNLEMKIENIPSNDWVD